MYIGNGNSKIDIISVEKYNDFVGIQNQCNKEDKTMEDFIKENVNKQNFLKYLIYIIYNNRNPYDYIEPLIQLGQFNELIKEIQDLNLDLEILQKFQKIFEQVKDKIEKSKNYQTRQQNQTTYKQSHDQQVQENQKEEIKQKENELREYKEKIKTKYGLTYNETTEKVEEGDFINKFKEKIKEWEKTCSNFITAQGYKNNGGIDKTYFENTLIPNRKKEFHNTQHENDPNYKDKGNPNTIEEAYEEINELIKTFNNCEQQFKKFYEIEILEKMQNFLFNLIPQAKVNKENEFQTAKKQFEKNIKKRLEEVKNLTQRQTDFQQGIQDKTYTDYSGSIGNFEKAENKIVEFDSFVNDKLQAQKEIEKTKKQKQQETKGKEQQLEQEIKEIETVLSYTNGYGDQNGIKKIKEIIKQLKINKDSIPEKKLEAINKLKKSEIYKGIVQYKEKQQQKSIQIANELNEKIKDKKSDIEKYDGILEFLNEVREYEVSEVQIQLAINSNLKNLKLKEKIQDWYSINDFNTLKTKIEKERTKKIQKEKELLQKKFTEIKKQRITPSTICDVVIEFVEKNKNCYLQNLVDIIKEDNTIKKITNPESTHYIEINWDKITSCKTLKEAFEIAKNENQNKRKDERLKKETEEKKRKEEEERLKKETEEKKRKEEEERLKKEEKEREEKVLTEIKKSKISIKPRATKKENGTVSKCTKENGFHLQIDFDNNKSIVIDIDYEKFNKINKENSEELIKDLINCSEIYTVDKKTGFLKHLPAERKQINNFGEEIFGDTNINKEMFFKKLGETFNSKNEEQKTSKILYNTLKQNENIKSPKVLYETKNLKK